MFYCVAFLYSLLLCSDGQSNFSTSTKPGHDEENSDINYTKDEMYRKFFSSSKIISSSEIQELNTNNLFLERHPLLKHVAAVYLGYEPVDGWLGYYKAHNIVQKNWYDALEDCKQEGAHLLVINSFEEAKAMELKLSKEFYWIGFHDQYQDGQYVTLFNDSLEDTWFGSWGFQQPDERSGVNCGIYGIFSDSGSYEFGVGSCEGQLPFICEQEVDRHQIDFDYPGKGSYKIYNLKMAWLDSVKLCEENGGHLLVIDSQKEANEILSLLDIIPYKGKDYWLGVHDQYKKGEYMTVFNQTFKPVEYIEWHSGSRSGYMDRNCIKLHYETSYTLIDWYCTDSQYIICEL